MFKELEIPVHHHLEVAAKARDIHAFLCFISNVHSYNTVALNLDIWQIQGVQKLSVLWGARPAIMAALVEYVSIWSKRLVSMPTISPNTKSERQVLLKLVRAISHMRFIELWTVLFTTLCDQPSWCEMLDPKTFSEEDIELATPQGFHVLQFIAAFGSQGKWAGPVNSSVCRDKSELKRTCRNLRNHRRPLLSCHARWRPRAYVLGHLAVGFVYRLTV
jgi:hypothetical protein